MAVADVDGFEADDREIDREGPTYTIDTLSSFPAEEELFVIMGADAAVGLPTWHRWGEILDRAVILVVPRPGTEIGKVRETLPGSTLVRMATLDISATAIREMAAVGGSYRFLVPPEVYHYVEANSLYAQHVSGDMVGDSNDQEESP
jgi:nicotinate-nucleotide adenylyltransferase